MSDLISRQAAIDALCYECQGRCIPCEHYPCGEVKALEQLPSAEPNIVTVTIDLDEKRLNEIVEEAGRRLVVEAEDAEPRKGKWLDDCGGVKCSVCGHTIDDPYYVEDYCTKCGSFNGEEVE